MCDIRFFFLDNSIALGPHLYCEKTSTANSYAKYQSGTVDQPSNAVYINKRKQSFHCLLRIAF